MHARGGTTNDCDVLPRAQFTYLETMLDRHCHQYGSYPRQASLDGGFASRGNLALAKSKPGLKDVAFAKKCGLTIESMVSSSWVYKQLRRFRAGIEGWLPAVVGQSCSTTP